jgi:hypothetical protein
MKIVNILHGYGDDLVFIRELLHWKLSITLCCNCQCGKHNYHKTNNTNANRKDTAIYVVHPNVGLRPPSIGIGYLIIQLMEITDKLTPLRHTLSLYGHTNL